MRMESHHGTDPEQRRLDRVVIAAAVAALYGPNACVRHICPVYGNRRLNSPRQGRLDNLRPHRATALAGLNSFFERGGRV